MNDHRADVQQPCLAEGANIDGPPGRATSVAGGTRPPCRVAAKRRLNNDPPSQVATALATGNHIVGITGGPEQHGGLSRIVTQGILLGFIAPEFESVHMPVKVPDLQAPVSLLLFPHAPFKIV